MLPAAGLGTPGRDDGGTSGSGARSIRAIGDASPLRYRRRRMRYQWVVTVVRQHCRGYCALIRYADDALAVFEREDDARRFWRVLPFRLGKFGLRLNIDKTHLLAFGKR